MLSFEFLAKPFGVMMEFIYNVLAFHNYGLAILIFTVIIKILLMPLQIKQQRSTLKTQALQPELDELRKVYANDRNKLAEEQQKLYAKHNVSMTAGCLPMLIQFPLLLSLYTIIRQPLTYISGVSSDVISKIATLLGNVGMTNGTVTDEIAVNNAIQKLATTDANYAEVTKLLGSHQTINMQFLKIFDLGVTPTVTFWTDPAKYLPIFFIPVLSCATAYLSTVYNTWKQKRQARALGKEPTKNSANAILYMMPLMSLVIAFMVPAGLGFYWAISNVLTVVQMIIIDKIVDKQKEGRL